MSARIRESGGSETMLRHATAAKVKYEPSVELPGRSEDGFAILVKVAPQIMTIDSNSSKAQPSADDFPAALQTLIYESFAAGVSVQGTYEITTSSSVVPSWQVTIEKLGETDSEQDPATFLDE